MTAALTAKATAENRRSVPGLQRATIRLNSSMGTNSTPAASVKARPMCEASPPWWETTWNKKLLMAAWLTNTAVSPTRSTVKRRRPVGVAGGEGASGAGARVELLVSRRLKTNVTAATTSSACAATTSGGMALVSVAATNAPTSVEVSANASEPTARAAPKSTGTPWAAASIPRVFTRGRTVWTTHNKAPNTTASRSGVGEGSMSKDAPSATSAASRATQTLIGHPERPARSAMTGCNSADANPDAAKVIPMWPLVSPRDNRNTLENAMTRQNPDQ